MKRFFIAGLIVLLAGAAAWWGWRRFRPPSPVDQAQPAGPSIDSSGRRPVVKDPAAAAQDVTIDAPRKKAESPPVDLTQHDGQTIDFSSGQPVVKDSAAERAELDKAAADMAAAAQDVTFDAPKQKAEPTPAKK